MDSKTFWRKFGELAKSEKSKAEKKKAIIEERIKSLEFEWLDDQFEFAEIVQVYWVSFDSKFADSLTESQKDQAYAQIGSILKKFGHKEEVDVDFESIMGGFDYDPVMLSEIHKVIPINGLELNIRLSRKELPKAEGD